MSADVDLLVVDDDPMDADLAMRVLSRHTARLVLVRDGQAALDVLLSPGADPLPHAILLDLKLPGIDGIEVLRHIKADERTKAIPVVVMSSSQEPRDVDECYRLGANSYVVKPVDADEYERAITEVVRYWLVRNQRRT